MVAVWVPENDPLLSMSLVLMMLFVTVLSMKMAPFLRARVTVLGLQATCLTASSTWALPFVSLWCGLFSVRWLP